MTIKKITVPDLGEATEVEVIELLVSVGKKVQENESLLVLESDKAAMEIPAPMSGIIKEISVNLGDQVTTGVEIMTLDIDNGQEIIAEERSDKSVSEETEIAETKEEADRTEGKSNNTLNETTSITIEVPDLGTEDEVDVIERHVKVGDHINADDSLLTVESDKAAMEVPSPSSGEIEKLLVKVGDKVKTGSKIALLKAEVRGNNELNAVKGHGGNDLEEENTTVDPSDSEKALEGSPAESLLPQDDNKEFVAPSPRAEVYAGPAVRKLARELGVDLNIVQGSGAKNRIVKEDIQGFVKRRLSGIESSGSVNFGVPDLDFSQFGQIEERKRSKLEKVTALNMSRSWSSVPHVAQFNEADVTDLEKFISEIKTEAEKKKIKLTYLPFLLKACAKTLAEYPKFNVSLHSSGEYVVQKKYCHIGIAVATEAGLLVPVVRDVDKKSIWDLASEVLELSSKAKERKLGIEDMQGACFSISSLGALGGTGFIPIVNSPEVGILGVAKTEVKPVFIDGEFKPRKMLPFTLSYDHRAVNGVDGGLFATYLTKVLTDVRHLIL